MTTFLFWNLNEKPLGELLLRLVELHRVDVLVLAEGESVFNEIPLWPVRGRAWGLAETIQLSRQRLRIWSRWPQSMMQPRRDHPLGRWTIRQIYPSNSPDILLVGVHLLSKLETESVEQNDFCFELAHDIRREEDVAGHKRTLMIGDFNINPFEVGMISASQLHAEATRTIAEKGSRTVQGIERSFFYNPMWNFFGDATDKPGGTYYYSGFRSHRVVWNMFDQVLLRPELLPSFTSENLQILTSDGINSFLDGPERQPGANNGSDHLPILLKLDLSQLLS